MEFLLGVGLFGKDPCWSKLILGEGCGGSEFFQGAREIQVEPEEGVMGERPECWVCWGFRVTPEECIPLRAGAGEQGIFQHIDGRAKLPPQSSAQCRLHWVFSHTVSSFVLLFSQRLSRNAETSRRSGGAVLLSSCASTSRVPM